MEYYNYIDDKYFEIAERSEIFPKFKIELLDHAENTIGEITEDITTDNAGSISVNYQQGVRRSCSITIFDLDGVYIPNADRGLFWIGSKFKLYVGLKDIFTDDIYWFSQGVYFVNNPIVNHNLSSKTVTINGVDKFGVFGSELGYNQLEGTYLIEAETNAYDAIKGILSLDMGNGNIIDPIEPILDIAFASEVLPYDIKKAPGQYLSEILIEIGNVLGADIYYNTDGRLVVESGTIDISYSTQSSIYEFIDIMPEYGDSSSLSHDFISAINVVKVVGTNINGTINEYTAENNNPLSPTRIELIGRKMKYVESANVYDLDRAQDYAEYLLNKESIVQTTMDFSCSLLPHLQEDEVVGITDSYFNYERQRFIIQSLTIPLSFSELTSVSASNVASLPYYDHLNG